MQTNGIGKEGVTKVYDLSQVGWGGVEVGSQIQTRRVKVTQAALCLSLAVLT